MTPLDMLYNLMMSQGVTAGLLCVLVYQSFMLQRVLLQLVCNNQCYMESLLTGAVTDRRKTVRFERGQEELEDTNHPV